jgi:hypothetical protein
LILDPIEKAVKLDDVTVPDPDQKAVLSEYDNYEPSAKKHQSMTIMNLLQRNVRRLNSLSNLVLWSLVILVIVL